MFFHYIFLNVLEYRHIVYSFSKPGFCKLSLLNHLLFYKGRQKKKNDFNAYPILLNYLLYIKTNRNSRMPQNNRGWLSRDTKSEALEPQQGARLFVLNTSFGGTDDTESGIHRQVRKGWLERACVSTSRTMQCFILLSGPAVLSQQEGSCGLHASLQLGWTIDMSGKLGRVVKIVPKIFGVLCSSAKGWCSVHTCALCPKRRSG